MWQFITDNIKADPKALRLKYYDKNLGFDVDMAITQIECRQRFAKKLSDTLARAPKFLFPSVLAGEQATSDRIARYHARLVGEIKNIVDMTSGLGIDAWHLADTHPDTQVTALDIDPVKTEALAYNANQLHVSNLHAVNADCRQFTPAPDTCYFIDPARRGEEGQRVFSLADCQPNILQMIPHLNGSMVIKASPMLDITHSTKQLHDAGATVTRAIAVGTTTECKELVFVCQLANSQPLEIDKAPISAVTITTDDDLTLDFNLSLERDALPPSASTKIAPGQNLLVPYPAVMKAGPYRLIAERLNLTPLAPNTHLYISDAAIDTSIGTCHEIIDVIPYESKHIKRLRRTYPAVRVTTRNFDVPADALRRKLGVRDGGDLRLFAVTLADTSRAMIICKEK